jgi:GxxExxY protein
MTLCGPYTAESRIIMGAAFGVHSALGPGMLEGAYEACLAHDLREHGLLVRTQVPLPLIYKGIRVEAGYRIDLLVEDAIVVEIKAIRKLQDIHRAQVRSYLQMGGYPVGMLFNFNELRLRDGYHRILNDRSRLPP